MDISKAWKILEMEPTEDEAAIKKKYRELLPAHNPEDDPEGFKALREAYELALHPPKEEKPDEPDDEIAHWLKRVEDVYSDYRRRRDLSEWEELLSDPLCEGLDSAMEVRERLLVFFMDHQYLPQKVWERLDKCFNIVADKSELLEKFPENYIDYVVYNTANETFGNYDFFEGEGEADEWLEKFYELNRNVNFLESLIEQERVPDADDGPRRGEVVFLPAKEAAARNPQCAEALNKANAALEECRQMGIYHPYRDVEEARLIMIMQDDHADDKDEMLAKARQLLEKYPSDAYIQRVAGEMLAACDEWEEALAAWEAALSERPEHAMLHLDRARYYYHKGDHETAEEIVRENINELNGSPKVKNFFLRVQQLRESDYRRRLDADPHDKDARIELCWSCFHSERIQETLELLEQDTYEPGSSEYYDYVDMKGRCLLELEQYEEALKYLKEWEKALKELPDDGSDKYKKRKKTLGYQCFVLAECYGDLAVARGDKSLFDNAEEYIDKALEVEDDGSMLLPYRDLKMRILLRQEKYKLVVDLCDERLKEDKNDLPAYLRRQEACYRLHDGQAVVDDYHSILALYKDYYKPYLFALRVFMVYGQTDDAEKVLEAADAAGVKHRTLELERVRLLRQKDIKGNAEEILKRLRAMFEELKAEDTNDTLNSDPDDVKESELSLELALVSDATGQDKTAFEMYERTVELDPTEDRAVYELAVSYRERFQRYELPADYARSKELFDQLLMLNPSPFVRSARADLIKLSARLDDVIVELREALKASDGDDADDAYRLYRIGDMQYLMRRTADAEATFRETIEKYGSIQAAPIYQLADTLGSKGLWAEGLALLLKYAKDYENNRGYKIKIADFCICAGKPEEARRIYDEIHASGEWNDRAYYDNIQELAMLSDPASFDEVFAASDMKIRAEIGIEKKYDILHPIFWGRKLTDERAEEIARYYSVTGDKLLYARKLNKAIRYLHIAMQLRSSKRLSCRGIYRSLAIAHRLRAAKHPIFYAQDISYAQLYARCEIRALCSEHVPPAELMDGKTDYRSEERYLNNMPCDRAIRYEKLALMHLIEGNEKLCIEYLARINDCVLCLSCRYQECYDALIVRGYMAEIKRKYKDAQEAFRRAAAICPTDIENTMGEYKNRR